ncbi:uncharacterized protein LOC143080977 isoform X1 [Mytilus galloprovincialis]|uniref:Uncharacterized protein n=2 Tax=Mytilus galloprovincialis TaxID=29158 RepID=A0A8B6GYK4_MYTGA|nr:Hypothetical predicted protein [Mytilus galloprovincialis]
MLGKHFRFKNMTTITVPKEPEYRSCELSGEKTCNDGRCISKIDLCPEEQLMNQNTILIMIVVGIAVVIFLIVLYCFQQRQRNASRSRLRNQTSIDNDMDPERSSLFEPPPAYNEAIDTRLYPPTPQMLRDRALRPPSEDQPPMTPPPNYDTALQILARSHESVLGKPPLLRRQSSTTSSFRRSFSFDLLNNQTVTTNTLVPLTETNNQDKPEGRGDNSNQDKPEGRGDNSRNSDLTLQIIS